MKNQLTSIAKMGLLLGLTAVALGIGQYSASGKPPHGGGSGGGIYNGPGSSATVENNSSITGNTASDAGGDVENYGVLYLDNTSSIRTLEGNAAISFKQVR